VQAFQSGHGIPATGVLGPATWRALIASYPPPVASWAPLPAPTLLTGPSAVDLYVRATAGTLNSREYAAGAWGAWQSLGQPLTGAPAAAAAVSGPALAVRAPDSHVYLRPSGGALWTPLGGWATSSPAVSVGPAGAEVFVRGTDSAIWTRPAVGGSWTSLGGISLSAPAVVEGSDGGVVVVVVGTDHRIWQQRRAAGHWSGWSAVGGIVTADPSLSLQPGTRGVLLAVRGGDGAAWLASGSLDSAAWSSWTGLGGVLTSGPAVTAGGPGSASVTCYGSDSALWQRSLSGSTWTGWAKLP
jgi:hypothetical protein